MTEPADPDLHLEGFRLWVHGRERPDDNDYWDGNWLTVTCVMELSGARVEATGPFLRTSELGLFAEQTKALHATLSGEAELACMEPQLQIRLEGDGLGHIAATIELTPDHFNQLHRFRFDTDQTWLPSVLASCEKILSEFPVCGQPSD